jgi:hypothetical protein
MDPISLLLTVLSTSGQGIAEQALKDGYAGLKALIIRRFGTTHPRLESTLDDFADDPETYQKPAAKLLREAGVDRDQEIMAQAAELHKRAAPAAASSMTVASNRGVAIGGSVTGGTINTGDQPGMAPGSR